MNKIVKGIIAFFVVWIAVTIFYISGISYYIGALPGAILVGCIFGGAYYFVFIRNNKEPEPEPETNYFSFFKLIIYYVIICFGFGAYGTYFDNSFFNTNLFYYVVALPWTFIGNLLDPIIGHLFETN
tara:strand:- start:757 stop:1137 length:381 start_codon:yes stop_codon:yes gene_type:complete